MAPGNGAGPRTLSGQNGVRRTAGVSAGSRAGTRPESGGVCASAVVASDIDKRSEANRIVY